MKLGVWVLVALMLVIPGVAAEILMGQPAALYNKGDNFNISVSMLPNTNTNDFLKVSFICGETEVEIYRSAYNLKAGELKNTDISVKLDESLLSGVQGDCFLRAKYGSEMAESRRFEISRGVKVTLDIGGMVFAPEKTVSISGTAVKTNGQNVNGYVEITIPGIQSTVSSSVADGKFSTNFTIPSNSAPGSYDITAKAYEKDEAGNVINEGTSTAIFKVTQVVEKMEIALNEQSITPGREIIYTAILYDQAGNQVSDDVAFAIYSPDKKISSEKLAKSLIAQNLMTISNSTPGYWTVEAKYQNKIVESKQYYIEEVQNASFTLANKTLVIENIGNVPYTKAVQISIGGNVHVEEMNLGLGEKKEIKLRAPNGEYSIEVLDDSNTAYSLGSTYLTGRAIGIGDGKFNASNSIIWIIIILILAAIAFFYYTKIYKKKFVGSMPQGRTPVRASTLHSGEDIKNGEKHEAVVVSLKIKNYEDIKKSQGNALDSISRALGQAKNARAHIIVDGEYRLAIFAEFFTKQKDNNMRAIKAAQAIENELKLHNKKYAQKINFGVGVHMGELIAESAEGVKKFTSIGTTIPGAKKIASISNQEVLLSEAIQRKVMTVVKTQMIQGQRLWKITKIIEREEHSGFINKFMNRQDGKSNPPRNNSQNNNSNESEEPRKDFRPKVLDRDD